ncbi:DHA2 family efflux MFS transporter permease subunit [Lacisediminihabitans changchengi]|uniref:DHA2 family efflux MFS transporter permease subunit n=1 Tax=Lacisediminihabitans changchengi TaxID=2787634 RepID=A0A934VXZ0_9MICO|nr:DHA2 family efflux MFS transporter permease subunit [Lacisediminihabitans changchengi]MBK4347447.1 DHA2 family efflux MFS transporter permease subunit [Lacisediminihabitans changchengi]
MSTQTTDAPASTIGAVARYGLLIGPLLSMIDSSIVNVAVPDIATELTAQLDEVQWVVSGYLLALGVSLALTAYLAKRYGVLRVYTVSMVLFVLASAACAVAPNIEFLIAFRAVQGFVGAPLVPLALSILLGKDGIGGGKVPISAALTLFLAPALGPTLGGLLIGAGGWRWIFIVNVPVGVIGLLLLLRVPTSVGALGSSSARFDPVGFVLLALGLTGALFGATEGTSEGWDSPVSWLPLGLGLALLVGYVFWALRRAHPAVDLQMMRHRNSAIALVLQVFCSVVAFGTVFLLPVFTQSVQGHSAFATGIALLPQGIVMGVATFFGQKLSVRVPLKILVVSGFAILAISSVFLITLEQDTPLWATALILSGRAIAIGLVTAPLLVAMLAPLPEDQLADGNTLFNITQRLGGSIGVSILGSVVAGGATLAATIDSFHLVGAILVAIAVVAGIVSLFLTQDRSTPVRSVSPLGE